MIDSRYFHACGKFMMGNQVVLIVSGNSGDDSSVEFFPLNDESNWIRGNDSMHLKKTFLNTF